MLSLSNASRAQRGTSTLVGAPGIELEPFCGRERSGSPQAKSRAQRRTSPATAFRECWRRGSESNLSRFAGGAKREPAGEIQSAAKDLTRNGFQGMLDATGGIDT